MNQCRQDWNGISIALQSYGCLRQNHVTCTPLEIGPEAITATFLSGLAPQPPIRIVLRRILNVSRICVSLDAKCFPAKWQGQKERIRTDCSFQAALGRAASMVVRKGVLGPECQGSNLALPHRSSHSLGLSFVIHIMMMIICMSLSCHKQ